MLATICRRMPLSTKTSLMKQEKDTISIQFSGQLVRLLHWILRTVDSLFAALVCWDGFSRLSVQSLVHSDGFGEVFTLFHRTVFYLGCWVPIPNCVHVFYALLSAHVCMIFFLIFRRSVRRIASSHPIASRDSLWHSVNWSVLKSFQHGVIFLFIYHISRNVTCVINSLSLSVPMTRRELDLSLSILWNR